MSKGYGGEVKSSATLSRAITPIRSTSRIGSAVSRAYNRTSMLERRRPLMAAWADFVTGKTRDNVVPFMAAAGE